MAPPCMAPLLDRHSDHALRTERECVVLHPTHRKLAGVVKGGRDQDELDVLVLVLQPGAHALPGHVVHADPHHESEYPVTRRGQKCELLAAQVAREQVRGFHCGSRAVMIGPAARWPCRQR